ncbi:MAG: ABC transporter ATP-binding protein [Anaerolineae bacterium]
MEIERGEIFGIVGETGCGKTVTALSVMRLLPASARVEAKRLCLNGQDLLHLSESEMAFVRGGQIGMVFQDPTTSLNPLFTVGDQVARVITAHLSLSRREVRQRVIQLFSDVRLPEPEAIYRCYPHQLSGGMQQRIMIAMALAAGPGLLIADEPTTALDVTIQAQILELLLDLRAEKGITILLITHNLAVVAEVCERVAVFYAGQVVEITGVRRMFHHPQHPYTRALIAAVPKVGSDRRDLKVIPGSVPTGVEMLPGCAFAPRCELCNITCMEKAPVLRLRSPGHWVSCHHETG